MNKFFSFMLTLLGLNICTACGKLYKDVSAEEFAALMENPKIQILDVRSAKEYQEGHIPEAISLDVNGSTFVTWEMAELEVSRQVAGY